MFHLAAMTLPIPAGLALRVGLGAGLCSHVAFEFGIAGASVVVVVGRWVKCTTVNVGSVGAGLAAAGLEQRDVHPSKYLTRTRRPTASASASFVHDSLAFLSHART